MRQLLCITAAWGLLVLDSQPATAQKKSAKPAPTRSVIYKEVGDVKLMLHIFEPAGHKKSDKRPAVVFFHGGAFKGGSPNQFYWMSEYLASRGMVATSAQYRLSVKSDASVCITDGKSAIRWMRAHAKELGVDPNRIAAGGGSAGGTLAAATDVLKGLDEKSEDLSVSSRPNLLILFNPAMFKNSTPLVLSDYTKDMSNTLLMVGTKDSFLHDAKKLFQHSTEGGWNGKTKVYTAEGAVHGFFNGPPWRERTAYLMDQFLAEHGYTKGEPTLKLDGGVQMERLK
ncbi:MAG: alpha/beta hydrolase [Acidobacteriales bacterium]|nr:alpha/beta hydrolase [Terriglobales bacterium]